MSIATTRPEDPSTRTPSNNSIGLWRCQVGSPSLWVPLSTSREASSISLSQDGLDDGSVREQDCPAEVVGETAGAGVAATKGMAEGMAVGGTGTAVGDGTTCTAPDGPTQAPHNSANPTAISFHARHTMPTMSHPSDGQHRTPATPQSRPSIAAKCRTPTGTGPVVHEYAVDTPRAGPVSGNLHHPVNGGPGPRSSLIRNTDRGRNVEELRPRTPLMTSHGHGGEAAADPCPERCPPTPVRWQGRVADAAQANSRDDVERRTLHRARVVARRQTRSHIAVLGMASR